MKTMVINKTKGLVTLKSVNGDKLNLAPGEPYEFKKGEYPKYKKCCDRFKKINWVAVQNVPEGAKVEKPSEIVPPKDKGKDKVKTKEPKEPKDKKPKKPRKTRKPAKKKTVIKPAGMQLGDEIDTVSNDLTEEDENKTPTTSKKATTKKKTRRKV